MRQRSKKVQAVLAFATFNALLGIGFLRAQSQAGTGGQSLAFEVASIKPDPSGGGWMNFDPPGLGSHWSASNVTIKFLIELAFDMKDYQVSGQPTWANSKRYDIEADIDAQTAARIRALPHDQRMSQLRAMLLSLLADRCKLSVSHVTRRLPSYALTATKDAPTKLKPLAVEPFPNNPLGFAENQNWGNGKMRVKETKSNFTNLAEGLSGHLGMPVADHTGLSGNYTYTLSWIDDTQSSPGATPDPAFDHTLEAALRDQLGLKLESTKTATDTIVIDHIEEPTPN